MTKTSSPKIAPLITTLTILSLGSFLVWLRLEQTHKLELETLATENLATAKKLNSEATELLKTRPQSINILIQAKSQLKKAVTLVAEIPPETSVTKEAQQILANYRQQDNLLRQQIDNEYKANAGLQLAKNFAQNALKIAENPPHTTEIWQQAANQWQQAIAQLESIPPNTSFAPIVTIFLKSYRDNYQTIQQRSQLEKQAENNLQQAQDLAQQAEITENTPHTLKAWQEAQDKLQQALKLLKAIPNTTNAYNQSLPFLVEYNQNLTRIIAKIQEYIKESVAEELRATVNKFIEFENSYNNNELTYEQYQNYLTTLQIQFNNLTKQPDVREFAAYNYLINAFNNYQKVLENWAKLISLEKIRKQQDNQKKYLEQKLPYLVENQAKYQEAEAQKARITDQQINNLNQATQLLDILRQQAQSARQNLINARDHL